MKRWLRRIGKIFLGLCLFWTVVHVVEDWRGERAWEAWQRDQIAKGAIYDPAQLQGPPIPDADNFAKAPIIQERLQAEGTPFFPQGFKLEPPKDPGPDWRSGCEMDLKAWMDANHTNDLSAFFAPTARRLDELSDATRRSGSRFDFPKDEGDYHGGFLGFRSAARVLNLRALIALRAGDPEAALQAVLTELRLARQVAKDPILTSQTLQLALSGIAMQAIWEGLEARAWNDAQLAKLEDELSRQDELKSFLAWGRDERIGTNRFWSNLAMSPWKDKDYFLGSIVGHALIPRGWIYRNMLAADQHLAETWLKAVDPGSHRMYPDKVQSIAAWWDERRSTPYIFMAKDLSSISAGAMAAEAQRFADRQVSLDEAYVVCALERYRLAHKAYPDSLNGLVPVYAAKLPDDVFTGQPLRYKRTGDAFLLYSVGWDEKDEGGKVAMKPAGCPDKPPVRDWTKGDWPWPQPAR